MVLFFPEGTSSDGEQIRPFRTSLFEAPVRAEAEIRTACVRYTIPGEGRDAVRQKVAYWGNMSFGPHMMKLFTLKTIEAVVEYSPVAIRTEDRIRSLGIMPKPPTRAYLMPRLVLKP